MTDKELTLDDVLSNPELVLIDVRPREERFGDLGYIPGSRSVRMCWKWMCTPAATGIW